MPGTRRGARKPANAALLDKEPAASHQALADFIASTTGHMVAVGDVALVQRVYPLYLKSPAVAAAKRAEKEQRERAAAERAAEKRRRAEERLAALNEQRRKLLDELGIDGELEGQDAPVLSLVPSETPDEVEEPEAEEPRTIVLAESEDDFVEGDTESDEDEDDDLWEDSDEEVEDF